MADVIRNQAYCTFEGVRIYVLIFGFMLWCCINMHTELIHCTRTS
jgi:hypothetical protein